MIILLSLLTSLSCRHKAEADIILINGKIITVDSAFSVHEAIALAGDKILATGSDEEIKSYSGRNTIVIDLKGKTVLPGLIDAHLHPDAAAVSELREDIPDVENIDELLDWIGAEAAEKKKGEWIVFQKFFFTRMKEMRMPSLEELDKAAPDNPVFLNGSFGGIINSCAMKVSGISSGSSDPGVIKNSKTGKPTGFIRASAFQLLNIPKAEQLSREEWIDAFQKMMSKYNQSGITSVFAGTGNMKTVETYRHLADSNMLTVRIFQNILYTPGDTITYESVSNYLKKFNEVTGSGNEWVRVGPLKVFLDGGILTGTAYMKEPLNTNALNIFHFENASYRGVSNLSKEQLLSIVSAANDAGWSFTAHATGDASTGMLIDVYNEVSSKSSIKSKRFSVIHGNFFDEQVQVRMKEMNVYANIQPAWYFKDADAMLRIHGEDKMRIFQPYRSMISKGIILNGGSDHMVKLDADASINPYNPFTAMWSMVTRKTINGTVIMPEEAISREDAIKCYTINNARASFEENIKGSLEPGKLADMVIISSDILTCNPDSIRNIKALMTILGGKIVWDALQTASH